jgi:hypothetical protein
MKLADIVVVSMLGFVEDEWTFSMFAFMKDKLRNRLGLHLDTTVCMFAQKFYIQESFPYRRLLQLGKIKNFGLVLPLSSFCSFHNTKLKCLSFHNLNKCSDRATDCTWFFMKFINIWVWWVGL